MNDRQLENLVRMALEVDELERPASDATPLCRGSRRAPRALLWAGLAGAAAAACALPLLLRSSPRPVTVGPAVQYAAATALDIAYCPGERTEDGRRVARFEPSAAQYCAVLAIFYTWHNGCRCLSWKLHEWDDGSTVAEITPGQEPEITLDVTDTPAVEQVLLVAISDDPGDLPSSEEETCGLIDCLNEVTPSEPASAAAAYASAVKSCLPASVRVVPRSFMVE